MSDRYDELGHTLRTLLLEEAEVMEIDTHTASERLARELTPDSRRPWVALVAVGAAAAVVAAVLVGLLSSGGPGEGDESPVGPGTPSASTDTAASSPYFVDLSTLGKTPAPEGLADILADSFYLWFSPNGDRIAWGTCLGEVGLCSHEDESYVANADGTGQRQVTFPGGLNSYVKAWSPDGSKLLYQVRSGGTDDVGNLFIYDVGSGQATQLTNLDINQGYWHILAGFSTDGQEVIYDLARPPGVFPSSPTDVWSVRASGGTSTRLFRDAGYPAYLADGRVAFVRDGSIFAAEPGAQPTKLAESEGFVVSPDGTLIGYDDGERLTVLDVASGESTDLGSVGDWTWAGNDQLLVLPPE